MERTGALGVVGVVTLATAVLLATACGSKDDDGLVGSGLGGAGSGAGGSQGSGSAATGGAAAGGACSDVGGPCSRGGDCCDTTSICNSSDAVVERNGCRKRCSLDSECDTGCCLHFQAQTFGMCTDARWCSCGEENAPCGGQNPACCDDQTCVGNQSGGGFSCRPKCTVNADCATSCCIEIVAGQIQACLDPVYCGG